MKKRRSHHTTLVILFVLVVFCILSITMIIIGIVIFGLEKANLIVLDIAEKPDLIIIILTFAITSIIIGTFVSLFICHIPLTPINRLIDGMNKLASGDYDTRISFGHSKIGTELAQSFNTLAEELNNTEMLRSDFVNNFSHEFKTPIVSILGFAKLLNKGNLSDEQVSEYLNIIEQEASRLSLMATNVLDLAKIENQHILTDITQFNLSEQLRTCVLLLERQWTKKQIKVSLEFDEYMISANVELLKQVWINLLDNAVKFAEHGGFIEVSIHNIADKIIVGVKNSGSEIEEADSKRIFNKFYQSDTSHTTEGNGLGLAITEKIVLLHHGNISASSKINTTTFTVELPNSL